MLAARYAARSDIGHSRQTNEDSWLARPPVFAVADGMGGARAGEVASRVALDTLAGRVADVDPRDREEAGRALLAAAEDANRRVWELSTEQASKAGMGTTLTALALCTDGARLAHIGDSRAYLLRGGLLTQLTDDHSLVAEMVRSGELTEDETAAHPLRSVLSRALGTEPDPVIDLLDVDLSAGDVLLLCSDGLTGPVDDDGIAALLAGPDPEEVAQALVAEALDKGGPDNITVLVIRLDDYEPKPKGDAVSSAAATAGSQSPGVPGPGTAEIAGNAGGLDDAAAATADAAAAAKASGSPDASRVTSESAADAGSGADGTTPIDPATPAMAATATTAATSAAPSRGRGARGWRGRLIVALCLVAVLVAGVLAARQVEWVGVADDGVVTVYRGVPWEFAGLRLFNEHERVPMVRYEELSADQRDLVDAQPVGWRGSGEDLLDELESTR